MQLRLLSVVFFALLALAWPWSAYPQGAYETDLTSARQFLERGAFEQAAEIARRLAKEEPADYATRLEAHLIAGQALLALGRVTEAVEVLAAIEKTAKSAADQRGLARVLLLRGAAEFQAGQTESSRESLVAAREISLAIGDAGLEARSQLNLALALARDRPSEAQAMLRDTSALASKVRDDETKAAADLNLARLLRASAEAAELLGLLKSSRETAELLPDSFQKAQLLAGVGDFAVRLWREKMLERDARALAEAALRGADAISQRTGDRRTRSYALGFLAEWHALDGNRLEALALNQRAVLLAHQAGVSEALYRWYWQQGRLIVRAGARDQAVDSYRRAVRYLSEIRTGADLGGTAIEGSFREIFGPLYLELAELLLLQSAATPDGAKRQDLLREARNVIESSKAAELQDYFQDNCVAAQQARVAGLDQLEPGSAVLYPVLLPDRIELLLSHAGGISQVTVAVPGAKLVAEVRAFRERLEKRTTREYGVHARRLYQWLIQPVEGLLKAARAQTIVVVPDGPLRTIPLAALHDGKRFLIERYAFAVTPGLTLTDPRPFPKTGLRALLTGLTEPVQGFSALPNVATELRSIRSTYEAQVLQDRTYLISRLEDELVKRPYSLVHIASHGQFDSDPKKTFLLAYDGRVSMDLLERLIAPTRLREQAIELLSLSACQTAAGDDRAALGLAGVAIKAGARSALASLWFINDESSAMLVGEFYRRLRVPGATKASALQAAQRALIADRRYSHPAYWAPFLLIGNWL